ncbi:MAG: hypothetical protein KDD67_12790 [Ignavibacteriae bacterium]|nr:hypothetical protein [Ignavibacteriota bacterium]MCB9214352.1 hypothetical protein [Ignavibacteria bacterium]
MATQDIQEMLEGMLNDEQTAEVLHRLSVSPEKLTAFRQHMALRGAFEEDARIGELNDEEDDAVWAAVLGATGGLVTGGTAVGASGWLAKAAAFLVTGLAGFFIGTAVDGTLFTSEDNPAVSENVTQVDKSEAVTATMPSSSPEVLAAATPRVDTVIQTVVQYRDRIKYKYVERPSVAESSEILASEAQPTAAELPTAPSNKVESLSSTTDPSTSESSSPAIGISQEALAALQKLDSHDGVKVHTPITTPADDISPATNVPPTQSTDPNEVLRSERSTSSESDDPPSLDKSSSAITLMQNGFEVGYNERLGRITALPRTQGESNPNYNGRAIELTGRMLNGRVGLGARLIYGSFSTVTLTEEIQNIGFADTLLVPSLQSTSEFDMEVFANYRIPLFTERFALGLEGTLGLSSSRLRASGNVLATYLITNQVGVQGGVGYGLYRYTTQQIRESRLDQYENASITDDFIDFYEGTQIEGRYGLFFRF